MVVVHGPISARRSRGIAASRESTTTGRLPISGSSHHQTSPRSGTAVMTGRPRHGTRQGLPTRLPRRGGGRRRPRRPSRSLRPGWLERARRDQRVSASFNADEVTFIAHGTFVEIDERHSLVELFDRTSRERSDDQCGSGSTTGSTTISRSSVIASPTPSNPRRHLHRSRRISHGGSSGSVPNASHARHAYTAGARPPEGGRPSKPPASATPSTSARFTRSAHPEQATPPFFAAQLPSPSPAMRCRRSARRKRPGRARSSRRGRT